MSYGRVARRQLDEENGGDMGAIADLLGLTTGQLMLLAVAGVVLVVLWAVVRRALKMASRVFAIGCVGILVLVGVLYLLYAFVR
jgi:tetrahydromethanopterin S-methyltransferase subunit D